MYINMTTGEELEFTQLCVRLNASIARDDKVIGPWRLIEDTDAPVCPDGFVAEEDGVQEIGEHVCRKWKMRPMTEAEKTREHYLAFEGMRHERNRRLTETDYMLMPDYPLDEQTLEKVRAYRQALRDLPGQTGAPWTIATIPWPKKTW